MKKRSAAPVVSLTAFRRRSAPVSVLTLTALLFAMVPARPAEAAPAQPAQRAEQVRSGLEARLSTAGLAAPAQTGVGSAFTPTPSGSFTYRFSFDSPTARGEAQPDLALGYSSSAAAGVAGMGWNLTVPAITRLPPRGFAGPDTISKPEDELQQDRFVTSDGRELVFLCTIRSGACTTDEGLAVPLAPGERLPAWSEGWSYFRPAVEGDFQRYFFSPNRRTFRAQSRAGVTLEFGASLDASGYEAIQVHYPNVNEFRGCGVTPEWFAARVSRVA